MRQALRLLRLDDAWLCLPGSLRTSNSYGGISLPKVFPLLKRPLSICGVVREHSTAVPIRFLAGHSSGKSSEYFRRAWRKDLRDKAYASLKEDLETESQNLPIESIPLPQSSEEARGLWQPIDAKESYQDFDTWLKLANARRRAHGPEGIRLLWKAILHYRVRLPTTGPSADGLWTHFLDLGFEDPDVLGAIFVYAKEQKESHARCWPNFYITVVGHHLKAEHGKVWLWHTRLHKDFPPSSQQFRQLFALALPHDNLHRTYLSMHASLPGMYIYDYVIPQLCRQGLYHTAANWHEKLIRRGDIPSDARQSEPVLRYLATIGDETRLKAATRLMVEAGVSFAAYRNKDVEIPSFILRDIVLPPPLEQTEATPEKKLGDQFCARLFATRVLSVDTAIGGLVFLGATEIGPQALRAMATRELGETPYHCAIKARLDQLKENGITTGDSTFSILVRKFTAEGDDHLLRNVITCDLHSDTFEDCEFQESLLPRYQEQSDPTAFTRTITSLTAKLPTHLVNPKRWNYLLRSFLMRRDLQGFARTIEKMQDLRIRIEMKSVYRMRPAMLSPRRRGHCPRSIEELPLVIGVWQSVLRSERFIHPMAWAEVLRRLGMTGQLHSFENLSFWLAGWYSSREFRASQMSMSGQTHQVAGKQHHPLLSVDVKPSNPVHPLQALFPRALQQGIIAWGFKRDHLSQNHEPPRTDWTWGITLLHTLRFTYTVHVSSVDVAKALKLRLFALFGRAPRRRGNLKNVRTQRNIRAGVESYIEQAENIWGRHLLSVDNVMWGMQRKKERVVVKESRRVGGWTVAESREYYRRW